MAKIIYIDTEYVRLDGGKFTIAPTRGQFYGAKSKCKRPTISDREWAAMVRDTIEVERRILQEMNVIMTTDIIT